MQWKRIEEANSNGKRIYVWNYEYADSELGIKTIGVRRTTRESQVEHQCMTFSLPL